jgi:hypothetical protein
VDGLHWLLVGILVADALQLASAVAALAQGRRRRGREEHRLADYSLRHSALLAAGSLVLAVPAALGLTGVIGTRTAVWAAVAVEVVALVVSRTILARLHERFAG